MINHKNRLGTTLHWNYAKLRSNYSNYFGKFSFKKVDPERVGMTKSVTIRHMSQGGLNDMLQRQTHTQLLVLFAFNCKPRITTVFTRFWASASKNHGIYSVLWPGPSKNIGIYAVSSMLSEAFFRCQRHKNIVNYRISTRGAVVRWCCCCCSCSSCAAAAPAVPSTSLQGKKPTARHLFRNPLEAENVCLIPWRAPPCVCRGRRIFPSF